MPAGALHATAAVRYVDHAALRAACHVLRANFSEALNADHAALTAAPTALRVVLPYACCRAVALAAYAALTAPVYAVMAVSTDCSRAFTAAPTQIILAATEEVAGVLVVVWASTGNATAIVNAIPESAKSFLTTKVNID